MRRFGTGSASPGRASRAKSQPFQPRVERLEDRTVPSTFTVSTLADSGPGSLRQAILDANANPGADLIDFAVAGTVLLTSAAFTPLTDEVVIDGTTAPGFAGTPVVEIDYNGFSGLRFAAGSGRSMLQATGHVGASGSGVVLDGRNISILGNYIGLRLDGATVLGNTGNGLEIREASAGNTIGGPDVGQGNVISGNGGNGIAILGSSRNTVVANFIGTDATGSLDRGNTGNGVLIASRATLNTIGGVTPDTVQFSGKAPDGNVISGNQGNGVLIAGRSRFNTLSANFIGTDLAGLSAVGNTLDGVLIVNSNDNSLIGTFRNLDPFVFYNVVGGNGANGLRVRNSDNTVVHANFFGLGADNNTAVGNALNGAVIEGDSANTIFGGVIPLGNVTSANGQNGVVVQDTASGFLAFNSFCGIAAFTTNPNLGNALDGFLITSTGGGNALRTSIISANGDDGVEISGRARGVQVVQCFMGTDTVGNAAIGNGDNGVEIGGRASGNVIGGRQPDYSITPRNLMSGNAGHGVAVVGRATNNQINFSYIGTDAVGDVELGNAKSGVFLGQGTSGTRIGSRDPQFYTLISGNDGHGIEILGSTGNTVIATSIGTVASGAFPLPNQGSGVFIVGSTNNRIGGVARRAGNTIAFNLGSGVRVESGRGNSIRGNSIHTNAVLGIELGATGNPRAVPPVLTSAVPLPGNIRVAGTVTGAANSVVTVDVFANFDDEPLPVTEGWFYLGSVQVTLDARGRGRFVLVASNPPPGVQTFTATATNAAGSTSEFSDGILSFALNGA